MALTRKQRIAIAALFVAAATAVWLLGSGGKPLTAGAFYGYLEQHPTICRAVRVAFVITGNERKFDARIRDWAVFRALSADWPELPRK